VAIIIVYRKTISAKSALDQGKSKRTPTSSLFILSSFKRSVSSIEVGIRWGSKNALRHYSPLPRSVPGFYKIRFLQNKILIRWRWAYHLSRLQYSSQLSNFDKTWAFVSNKYGSVTALKQ
jgi:hypothetical protein